MTFLIFALGAAVGSFLNVLIDRIPKGEDIVWKPSHCDYCKKNLRWYELIPIVSYTLQRGRCLRCRKRLSMQYPLIELVTALGFVWLFPNILHLAIYSAMLVLFVIDWKHMILPDVLLWIVLAVGVLLGIPLPSALRINHILAGVFSATGFLVLWLVTRGRGLGFGDVKLVGVLGLLLGYPATIISLYVAFLTGALYGVILMIISHANMKSRIAFGPFLIVGTLVGFLWADAIWEWWVRIL